MSRPGDSTYAASTGETTDGGDGTAPRASPAGTEIAAAPPAETMTRAEYNAYMMNGPAAGADDDTSSDDNTGDAGVPGGELGTTGPRGGIDAIQPQDATQAATSPGLDTQPAAAGNNAGIQDARTWPSEASGHGGTPAGPPAGQQDAGASGRSAEGTAGGPPDPARASLAADEPAPASQALASADSTGAPAQRTDPTEGETEEAAAADAPAMTRNDQPTGQGLPPDADPGQQRVPGTETRPDQHADEQRWAAFEQRLQAVDQLRQEVSDLKADRDASEARHKAEIDSIKAEYEARISDLEANTAANQQEQQNPADGGHEQPAQSDVTRPGEPRGALTASEQADAADLAEAATTVGSGRDENLAQGQDWLKRPVLSKESMQAVNAGAGLAGSFGLLPPGLALAMGGESARQAVKDMPPEDQYDAMELAHTAFTAFGSYPPQMAVAGIMASVVAPALHARIRDIMHKIRRKD